MPRSLKGFPWLLAALLSGCATLGTTIQPQHAPDETAPMRAIGHAVIDTPDFAGRFDLSLLIAPPDRLRLDLMLPVGTPAAILFVETGRWILLDPAAAVAWYGTLSTLHERLETVAPALQGTLTLALAAASRHLPRLRTGGAAAGTTATATGWDVVFSEPLPGTPTWSKQWLAQRDRNSVKVEWIRIEPLPKEQQWLLEPRVPQSFSWQPWRSALPAATAPLRQPAHPRRQTTPDR